MIDRRPNPLYHDRPRLGNDRSKNDRPNMEDGMESFTTGMSPLRLLGCGQVVVGRLRANINFETVPFFPANL